MAFGLFFSGNAVLVAWRDVQSFQVNSDFLKLPSQ